MARPFCTPQGCHLKNSTATYYSNSSSPWQHSVMPTRQNSQPSMAAEQNLMLSMYKSSQIQQFGSYIKVLVMLSIITSCGRQILLHQIFNCIAHHQQELVPLFTQLDNDTVLQCVSEHLHGNQYGQLLFVCENRIRQKTLANENNTK